MDGGRERGAPWTAERLFAGPGRTRAAFRATDWAATPLGPVESWPVELRAAVRTVLPSRIPMLLWWGPELVQIFNDAYAPMLGDKYPAAVAQPGAECWSEIWDEVGPLAEEVFTGGESTYAENQMLLLRRHGYLEETYWTFSCSPVRGEDGAVAGIFVATSDVTARVLADRRLETLRRLGELSVVGADTAADACRAAVAVLGRRREDLPLVLAYLREGDEPRLVASAGAHPDAVPAAVAQVLAGGGPARVTGLAERRGADRADEALVLPLQVSGHAEPAGALVVGISPYRELDASYRAFLDLVANRVSTALTDALAYEAERRRAELLAELDAAKTRFFADVSHELRTPLTLIAGPLQDSLDDAAEPLPPGQRGRLEIAHRNVGRLRKLVDDILDFARIEGGGLDAERVAVDLVALTRVVAEPFGFAMRRAGLEFHVDTRPLPRTAHVDRDMWEKIVVNLLANALKFTIEGHVHIGLGGTGDEVVLTVSDTGVGIPADQQPLLFQRFHRVRGDSGRTRDGAGIGLALVHELVALHGGRITVESTVGLGSTFTVRLPYGAPDAAPPPAGTGPGRYVDEALRWHAHDDSRVVGSGPTVLVVDDSADLRAFLAGLLEPHYRVETAADGRAALERVEAHLPDLVLTDVMMPHLDGFGLLKALRADPRTARVPVVVLSARAGEEAAVEGMRAGADDYLVKPFSVPELLARVRTNLDLARLRNRESAWRKAITDAMQEAFFVLDDDGALVEVNDAFRRTLGYPVAELPMAPPFPWWPDPLAEPGQRERTEAEFAAMGAVDSGRTTLAVRHADGRRLWVEVVFSTLVDPGTGRPALVGTMRDVTATVSATERQAALLRLSTRLSEAADVREVLEVGAAGLRALLDADGALIAAVEPGGRVRALAGPDPLTEPVRATATEVARTGAPRAETDDEGRIGALVTPLGGHPPAVVRLSMDPPRFLSTEDRSWFAEAAGAVSRALHRAQTYELQRDVALTLQRSILGPAELPAGFAVRYEPAVQPLEVGGDWYDVVRLGEDGVGVVVGDCVGDGLAAATVMGQLRSACRALLQQAEAPGEVLSALDDFAALIPAATCTTVFCACVDTRTGEVRYAAAGHPPALLAHPDGTTEALDRATTPPLATVARLRRPEATTRLRDGSTLLLYTDGLVERRGETLDTGMDRALTTLAAHRDLHEDLLADRILRTLLPTPGYDDDVALLLYRHRRVRPFRGAMDPDRAHLAPTRRALRTWLTGAGLDQAESETILVVADEVCADAVRLAEEAGAPGRVALEAAVATGRVELVVRLAARLGDPSGRAHHLPLTEHLMDRVVTDDTRDGSTIRLRRTLPL